ncbi:hypothetical protein [Pedobacter sp. GR22-10]|uniref:hypothetical protein n=1 Tax=Pedobacter sp. GR22-10 TaxID=2994472 RepID=UPI00224580E6|nr:hypothetical protein [Pedobacter sp. GR22-10]MCX2429903.1 hypothetical protein [Pedobacter sp. GR22-10]
MKTTKSTTKISSKRLFIFKRNNADERNGAASTLHPTTTTITSQPTTSLGC